MDSLRRMICACIRLSDGIVGGLGSGSSVSDVASSTMSNLSPAWKSGTVGES
jgi:hypothetical protein